MRMIARRRAVIARLYATDAQLTYLRRLLDESFSHLYRHNLCLDSHHLDRVTKAYASRAITELVAAKQRGWTEGEYAKETGSSSGREQPQRTD